MRGWATLLIGLYCHLVVTRVEPWALRSFFHSYISAKQLPFQQYVALEINFSPLEACLFHLNRFLVSFSGIMQILFTCPSSFSTLILFITVPVCWGHVWSARREALELGKEETHFYTWTFPGAAFCSLTLGPTSLPPPGLGVLLPGFCASQGSVWDWGMPWSYEDKKRVGGAWACRGRKWM